MYSGAVIFVLLFILGYKRSVEANTPVEISDVLGFCSLVVFALLTGLYFHQKRVLLFESYIKKESMFGIQKFEYDRITKVVIDYSSGNSPAAITRLYCKGRKMVLESFLVEYENLIWELR